MHKLAGRVLPGLLGLVAPLALATLLTSLPGAVPGEAGPDDRGSGDPADPEPLAVVFSIPNGPVSDVPTIDVLFNNPMRPVGRERRGDEEHLLLLSADIAGRRHWIGSRALRLVPDRPLPRATAFTARVPGGIEDAGGGKLERTFDWTFSTPPPRVVAVRPPAGTRHLDPAKPIALVFDQPIDPGRLAAAIELMAGEARIAVTAAHPDSTDLARIEPLPAAESLSAIALVNLEPPLPLDTELELTIAAAAIAVEGPLPLAEPYTARFKTYGELTIHSATADVDGIQLTFSNPVDPESLLAHVALSGPARRDSTGAVVHGRPAPWLQLGARLAPGDSLRVEIDGELRDVFGQRLGEDRALELLTRDLTPEVEILPKNGTLAAGGPRQAVVRAINLERVSVRAATLTAEEAAPLLRRPWRMRSGELDPFPPSSPRARLHRLARDPNRPERVTIELDPLLGNRRSGGFVLIRASSPDRFIHPRSGRLDSLADVYSVVQVTDLGLMAKVTASEVLVWATSLRSGEPLSDVDLRIFDNKGTAIWRARTDAGGLARGPTPQPWQQANGWTLAGRTAADETLLLLDRDWELSPWAFNIRGDYPSAPHRADAFLFTDRDLYRAGDTVHVKGIVRGLGPSGIAAAPLDSVRLRISDPRGDEILDRRLALSEFGSFAVDVALDRTARLGSYSGWLAPIADRPVDLRGGFRFRLEAYRPAPFRVDLALTGARPDRAAQPRIARGESLSARVGARTYFDAPLAAAHTEFRILRRRAYFHVPPGAETLAGYAFDDPTYEETASRLVTRAEGELDSGGETQFVLDLSLPGVATPQTLEVDAVVRDAGDRVVTQSGLAHWHPSTIHLGVRAEPVVVAAGQPVTVDVIAIDLGGEVEPGIEVRLELVKRSWHTVMRQMVGGRLGYHSELVETIVDSALVITKEGDLSSPATSRFTPEGAGAYLVRARAADENGRETRSADFVYATGPGYVPWSRESGSRIELIADRPAYSPGDTARVLVQSPFPTARGLLTLERETIHEVIPFAAESTTPILRIPLGEEAIPNLFASVVLVRGAEPPDDDPHPMRPRRSGAADTLWSGEPEIRIGYLNLSVRPDERRLSVQVTPPKASGPGDSVTVRVLVESAADRSPADAEVTLMLVDEAVLALLGTRTPDPFAFFYSTRGLGVVNSAKALHVVQVRDEAEKGIDPAGGGGGEETFRSLFATTAFFAPDLRTGDDGIAEARFRLPENLTTFRAMAIACDRTERVGSGEAQLTVTRPLVLEPLLPRLARAGDQLEIGAILVNRSLGKLRVHAEFDVVGSALRLRGGRGQTVTIGPGTSRRVRFKADAASAGEAEVRLSARATGDKGSEAASDAVSLPLRVEEPLIRVVEAHYGVLVGEDTLATVPLALAADADPAHSSLEIQFSTSLIGGIESALTYLLEYPHRCLEQQASRLIALAVTRANAKRIILDGWDAARLAEATDEAIAEIASLGHWDGGYRLWPGSSRSDPYLSAYTLLALIEARDAGAAVDPNQLLGLGTYLKQEFDRKQSGIEKRFEIDRTSGQRVQVEFVRPFTTGDALTAALLAREAHHRRSPLRDLLRTADLDRLHAHQGDLGIDGKLFLAAALNSALPTDPRIGALLTPVLNRTSLTGGRAFVAGPRSRFGGDETSTAIMLSTLNAAWPDHELVPGFASWLSAERGWGHWRNTHATAYAVIALRDLGRRDRIEEETSIAGRATLGGAEVLLAHTIGGSRSEAARITWPVARLTDLRPGSASELLVTRHGFDETSGLPTSVPEKPLYHSVRVTAARPALAAAGADAGLVVTREYFPFDPLAPRAPTSATARAEAGDLVRVEVNVVVPRAASDLVLVDPLPAGLEPLVLDFRTVASTLGRALAERRRDDEGPESFSETRGMLPVLEVERRDDRVIAHAPRVPAGIYRFEYLVRAATPGLYGVPPATVELMYDPEIRSRSAATRFEVRTARE